VYAVSHNMIKRVAIVAITGLLLFAGQNLARAQGGFLPGTLDPVPGSSRQQTAPAPNWSIESQPATISTIKTLPPSLLNQSNDQTIMDGNIQQASCSSCIAPPAGGDWSAVGCPTTNCGHCCYPGRIHCCSICEGGTGLKRLTCGLYHCICCPDPCYEPRWIPTANAAFFVDSPRPVTHTRLRYDGLFNINRPDRAEYFMPQIAPGDHINRAHFHEFHLYTEIAPTPGFGFFINLPWRSTSFDPEGDPATPNDGSGFGDMFLGTKSVLLDCELLLLTFQFTAFLPTGSPAAAGVGTGHVSLEPALLGALKLTPDSYLQFSTALWIPLGGGDVAGNVLHNRVSYNQILYRFLPDVQLIGTLEMINYNVINGGYTVFGVPVIDRTSHLNVGPGLRLNICDRIDFGAAAHFSLTGDDFIGEAVRAEFRWRY
jgi:hypothetical protein